MGQESATKLKSQEALNSYSARCRWNGGRSVMMLLLPSQLWLSFSARMLPRIWLQDGSLISSGQSASGRFGLKQKRVMRQKIERG